MLFGIIVDNCSFPINLFKHNKPASCDWFPPVEFTYCVRTTGLILFSYNDVAIVNTQQSVSTPTTKTFSGYTPPFNEHNLWIKLEFTQLYMYLIKFAR